MIASFWFWPYFFLIWLYIYYWIDKRLPTNYALVWVANQSPKQINLQQTKQISFQGAMGESLIEVKKGRIRFIASPCQHKHCIHAGWLTNNGDFVVCLPNQVSIGLYGTKITQFDGIAY
ncbi:conserved hypothetical protein [Beggiatoa sp. PS]|nr:conserved hypothetical protein [Beggiatoa sp. PS]